MITINKSQFQALERKGLIKYDKANKNFRVVSQKKKSRRHKYAVTETYEILKAIREG